MDELQHLVLTRLNELGHKGRPLSARQAAGRSKGLVSFHTLYAIARGEHSGQLRDRTAEGLSLALQVPVERVYEAAGTPRPQTRWLLPERFDRLNVVQRGVVEDIASAILDAYEQGYEQGRRAR